jgi:hypothetical protein
VIQAFFHILEYIHFTEKLAILILLTARRHRIQEYWLAFNPPRYYGGKLGIGEIRDIDVYVKRTASISGNLRVFAETVNDPAGANNPIPAFKDRRTDLHAATSIWLDDPHVIMVIVAPLMD